MIADENIVEKLEVYAQLYQIPNHVAFLFAKLALNEVRYGTEIADACKAIDARQDYLIRAAQHKHQTEQLMEQWQ